MAHGVWRHHMRISLISAESDKALAPRRDCQTMYNRQQPRYLAIISRRLAPLNEKWGKSRGDFSFWEENLAGGWRADSGNATGGGRAAHWGFHFLAGGPGPPGPPGPPGNGKPCCRTQPLACAKLIMRRQDGGVPSQRPRAKQLTGKAAILAAAWHAIGLARSHWDNGRLARCVDRQWAANATRKMRVVPVGLFLVRSAKQAHPGSLGSLVRLGQGARARSGQVPAWQLARRQDGGAPYGRAGARPSRASGHSRAKCGRNELRPSRPPARRRDWPRREPQKLNLTAMSAVPSAVAGTVNSSWRQPLFLLSHSFGP